jgi:hypothetical protein
MQSVTQGVYAEIGAHYPFDNFGWVVDVGGGNGALLLPILELLTAVSPICGFSRRVRAATHRVG